MPKKFDYSYVRSYIETKSNGDCKLVSTEYINSATPLLLQCKCGKTFERTFHKLRTLNSYICPDCSIKLISKKYAYNLEYVKDIIKSKGCEYISGDYNNTNSKLTIRCKCGNIFEKDLNHFQRGQFRCPQCGNKSLRKAKMKYDYKTVKEILEKRGYSLLEKEYINCEYPMHCKCSQGHDVYIKFSFFLNNQSGCKICANNNLRGENHYNYKGGESEVLDYFRKHIKEWKKSVMQKYGYKCHITKSKSDFVIHHIKSFNVIIKEACEELNLPLYSKIKDYSKESFSKLENLVLQKHSVDNGIVIQRKIHNRFHSIYGKGNNTKEQFNDFLAKYYPKINPI